MPPRKTQKVRSVCWVSGFFGILGFWFFWTPNSPNTQIPPPTKFWSCSQKSKPNLAPNFFGFLGIHKKKPKNPRTQQTRFVLFLRFWVANNGDISTPQANKLEKKYVEHLKNCWTADDCHWQWPFEIAVEKKVCMGELTTALFPNFPHANSFLN